ncbi:MAG: hypothetical protein GWN18_05795, partial [Thermoplasmata archaeon]|nr:hypothetical protein [Thermoplasmata archaeon]NIS11564.1 hypothetical protein [Thermoplasmata archaeon]NIS19481.1 hypothetical protein [Thermoplasmata archaeon]NIT76611.1 hypothetical protein [Thermoplasmata archaeon]NIU48598.1 hypothetical protein [Thermoplasmata archaeon]
ALRLPGEIIVEETDVGSMLQVVVVAIAAVVGFGLVFVLERRSDRIKERLHIETE